MQCLETVRGNKQILNSHVKIHPLIIHIPNILQETGEYGFKFDSSLNGKKNDVAIVTTIINKSFKYLITSEIISIHLMLAELLKEGTGKWDVK